MRTEDGYIINKCLNGESEAFGFLVDKYKESVYAFAYTRLRNFQDAEDVTQEVFIKAYQRLRTLRRWDSFLAWLYSITSSLCKMHIRSQSTRPDREYVEDKDTKILDIMSLNSYHEEELSESVRDALEVLPEIHRQVLTLHYLGGMKVNEVARFLGTSPRTIARRLDSAKSQLKEEIFGMMTINFERRRLPAGFTLHIMDVVSRINIQPVPRITNLPWGLSLTAGIMLMIMSLGSHLSITNPMFSVTGSMPSSDMRIMEFGDIPVDVTNSSQDPYTLVGQGNDEGGGLNLSNQQNAVMMAPAGEGGKIPDKPSVQLGNGTLGEMAYSPDGKILAAVIGVGVRLYDADNFNEIGILPEDYPTSLAFSFDGKILAIGCRDDIGLWDVQTRKQIGSLPSSSWNDKMAFSPDGKILTSTRNEDNMIHLWDVEKLQQIGTLEGHTDYISYVLFSPDGELVSCDGEKTIRIWNVQEQKQIGLLEGHKNQVLTFAISPDGRILASGDREGELLLWNIQEQKLIGSLGEHKPWVNSLAFSPDGKTLASGSNGDQAIRIWDIQTQKQIALIQGNKGEASQVCFNHNGRILASMNYADPAVRFWDIQEQKQIGIIGEFTNASYSLAFSPDGKILASGESGGFVRVWDIQEQKSVGRFEGYYGYMAGLNSVAFSSDGKIIASINNNGNNNTYEIYLFDVQKQERIGILKGHTTAISSIAFTPDGKVLVSSGNQDQTVRLWDVDKQKELAVLNNNSWVHTVAISPDGETIAAAVGSENLIRLWNTKTQKELGVLNDPVTAAFSVAFSPDGKTLASCNQLGIIRIWNYKERKLIDEFQGPKPYGPIIFSPDGKWLITIRAGNVQFWDIQTQKEIATTQEQFHSVCAVAFSSDGRWMATSSANGTIQLWEVNIPVSGKSVNPMGKATGTWGDIKKAQLFQNYPNPFNPETWIPFSLAKTENVKIKIFNSVGRLVRTLDLGSKEPGSYVNRENAAYWDGRNENGETVASDVYFTVMEAGEFKDLKKMAMAK